jgi:hypothetical protein
MVDMETLCAPAILYVGFSLTHIIIDTGREEYSSAMVKFAIMVVFTMILDILCRRGLGSVSWVLVLVPFVSMTIITAILLSLFGVNTYTSTVRINVPIDEAIDATKQRVDEAKERIASNLSYDDVPYDPTDYDSGTPSEINHYNQPGDGTHPPESTDAKHSHTEGGGDTHTHAT